MEFDVAEHLRARSLDDQELLEAPDASCLAEVDVRHSTDAERAEDR